MSFVIQNAKETAAEHGCSLNEALLAELVEVLWCVLSTKDGESIADVLDRISIDTAQIR